MSTFYPAPKRPLGTRSELTKRRAEERVRLRDERAKTKWMVAQYVAEGLGGEVPLRAKAEAVRTARDGRLLPAGAPCSHEAVRQLEARWRAGERNISDYVDEERGHRKPGTYDSRLVKFIESAIDAGTVTSVRSLTADVLNLGRNEYKVEDALIPKYDVVHRMVRAKGPFALMAYGHGSSAAQLYGQAHGTVACRHTHDYWVIDETDADWEEQHWDYVVNELIAVRPTIITVRDYKSGAPLGYHISDPSRRIDPLSKRPMRAGYDARDVFAALLAASCPELAPTSTRPYSGHLPRLGIRWDNHSTHEKLRPILQDLGRAVQVDMTGFFLEPANPEAVKGTVSEVGIPMPRMRANFPKSRGDIERQNRFWHALNAGMAGHVDRVRVLDALTTSPGRERTLSAAEGGMAPRRDTVLVTMLPTAEEARIAFDERVRQYAEERVGRVHNRTPAARYHQFLPRTMRSGRDLLLALPVRSGHVQGNGIVVYDENMEHRFSHHIAGFGYLELTTQVTFRVDPLYRGIWLDLKGQPVFLCKKDDWAATEGRAKEFAQQWQNLARSESSQAAAMRHALMNAMHGAGTAEALKEIERRHLALEADLRRRAEAEKRLRDELRAATSTNAKLLAQLHAEQPSTADGGAAMNMGAVMLDAENPAVAAGAASASSSSRSTASERSRKKGASASPSRSAATVAVASAKSDKGSKTATREPQDEDGFDPMADSRRSRPERVRKAR